MICAAIPVLCVVMLDLLLHIKACFCVVSYSFTACYCCEILVFFNLCCTLTSVLSTTPLYLIYNAICYSIVTLPYLLQRLMPLLCLK